MKKRNEGQVRLTNRNSDSMAFDGLRHLRNRHVASLTVEEAKTVKAAAQRAFGFLYGRKTRTELNDITQSCFAKINLGCS